MARVIRRAKRRERPVKAAIGKQLIDIVTSGMYNNPLMVLREYVQNSVDAIDEALDSNLLKGDGRVDIMVDGRNRSIIIEDNGTGISSQNIEKMLCSIGLSSKGRSKYRGFRGIGRLGGVGYCDQLIFETRRSCHEKVAKVTWDCIDIRCGLSNNNTKNGIQEAINSAVTIERRKATKYDASHFFRVRMLDVHRFHKDELMNIELIVNYLQQVAPVPFNLEIFPLAEEIDKHLRRIDGYRNYDIRVNNYRIYRPHRTKFELSANQFDEIGRVELFDVYGQSRNLIGAGWFAWTQFLGAIPSRVGMRGIRIKQGNVEISNEYSLSNVYTERRFATWHIGEIHLGYSLKANARRDGFEQCLDHEAFLEQTNRLGKYLSKMCRASSKRRSSYIAACRKLARIENFLDQQFYLDEEHYWQTYHEVGQLLDRLNGNTLIEYYGADFKERLISLQQSYNSINGQRRYLRDVLDGRSLRYINPKDILANVAKELINNHESVSRAEVIINKIVTPYLKRNAGSIFGK